MQRRYQQGFRHNIPWYPKLWQLRQHPRSQDTNSYHQQSLWESQLKKQDYEACGQAVSALGLYAHGPTSAPVLITNLTPRASVTLVQRNGRERLWNIPNRKPKTRQQKTNDACAVWTHVPNSPCSCARNWPTQIDLCVFQNRTWKRMKICTCKSLLMRRDLTCCPNTQRRQI